MCTGGLASADEGGKFSGNRNCKLELTRLMIDGKDYPLVSSDYNLQGKGRGGIPEEGWRGCGSWSDHRREFAAGGKAPAIGAAAGGGAGAAYRF